MKKSKLVVEYDFDFWLAGIISSARMYKLAWEIQQYTHVHLVRQADLVVGFKDAGDRHFAYFSQKSSLRRMRLFRNKTVEQDAGKYLVPEFPLYDFILFGENGYEIDDSWKQIPSIEMIAPIPLEKLKSKSNFIF